MLDCTIFLLHLCYVTDMLESSLTLNTFQLRFPLHVCPIEPMNGIISSWLERAVGKFEVKKNFCLRSIDSYGSE